MDARMAADLDRHITGNWGEDSVPPEPPDDEGEITISLTRAQAAQLLATLEPNATGEVGAPQDVEIAYAVDTKVRLALGKPPLAPPDDPDFGDGWKDEGPPIHPGLLAP